MASTPVLPIYRITRILEAAHLPYMVVGAHAVFVYGTPRFSADLDVAIHLPASRRTEIKGLLERNGVTNVEWRDHPEEGRRLYGLDLTGMPVEFFLTGESTVAAREHARRRSVALGRTSIWFISPEDLVLRKLVNSRRRNAHDFEDAVGILKSQGPKIDENYIRQHCSVHRVCELYGRARDEARRQAESAGAMR